MDQTITEQSSEADASSFESGDQATSDTPFEWPPSSKEWIRAPLWSHTFTVLSAPGAGVYTWYQMGCYSRRQCMGS